MMKSALFYITNILSRITTQLLVRSKVVGDDNLLQFNLHTPEQRDYFLLENNRSSHHQILLGAIRQQIGSLNPEQILSQKAAPKDTSKLKLQDLIALQATNPDITINIYPVAIYHGRLPTREKSWLKLLNSESWEKPARLRHLLQLIFNGRQTLVHISKPLQLNQLADTLQHADIHEQKASRIIATHFQQLRSSVIGPDLSHRRTLISLVLKNPEVQKAIDLQATTNKTDRDKIEHHCKKVLNTIAADFNPTMTRVLDSLLNIAWNKLYQDIKVSNIQPVQWAAQTHQLIYLPCHRSHMDYLLLSWALYRHGLMLPHVAAGDNLNIPIIGPILKRAGAIFMRRRFQGDTLYRCLYKTYLQQMSHRGHSLEYFIEGGRSRTGRLLPPKTGLLSMSIETYIQEPNHPVAIIPVWISYDRLIESQSFQLELSGKPKQKETFGNFLHTLKVFKESYGEAQLSFGQPIAFSEHIDATQSLQNNVTKIANQTMQGINHAASINTNSILATCLLSSSEPINKKQIENQATQMRQLLSGLSDRHQSMPSTTNTSQWLTNAEKRKQLTINGDNIALTDAQKNELNFYRNHIQHLLILPALTLLMAYRSPTTSARRINQIIRTLYPFLQAELFLPTPQKKLTPVLKKIRDVLISQELLEHNNSRYSSLTNHPLTSTLILTAESVVLRYYITLRALFHFTELTEDDLADIYLRITGKIHHLYGYTDSEYSDKHVLLTFIAQLEKQSLITTAKSRLRLNFNTDLLFGESSQLLKKSLIELVDQELGINKKEGSDKV